MELLARIILLSYFTIFLASCNKGTNNTPSLVTVQERVSPSITLGTAHTCALNGNGEVLCWGFGRSGQLGHGQAEDTNYPVPVIDGANGSTPLTEITQISAGDGHTCALQSNGGVLCWGFGRSGQLGHGQAEDTNYPAPVVDGANSSTPLTEITQISVGATYTCALQSNGGVLCWGFGFFGQLGNGKTDNTNHPIHVMDGDQPLYNILQISSGGNHTCARTLSGGVKCWGFGELGQLGQGKKENQSLPVTVVKEGSTPLTGVIQIASGNSHTCALKLNREVSCWGLGQNGQLGYGEIDIMLYPVPVLDGGGPYLPLKNVVHIAVGGSHTCSLQSSGGVKCWGFGKWGQLGQGQTQSELFPVAVVNGPDKSSPLSAIAWVGSGNNHTCAIEEGGEVFCWGKGASGQLGHGETSHQFHPVTVVSGENDKTPLNLMTTPPN